MTGVQTLEVSADEADLRLDRWFRRRFPALSHGRLEKLLRTGQVRVDGKRAKAGARLAAGQTVRVPPLPDADNKTRPRRRRAVDDRDAEALVASVLHRDDHVIAINKPPGLAVQGGSRTTRHLDAMLDALRFDAKDRPRLVHRLDKDTSGVLLLGRTARATAALAETFRRHTAVKTYWALTTGVPKPRRGRIDLPLAKGPGRRGERVAPDSIEGKRAVTDFSVVEAAAKRAAWVALRPETGRTHQIRAHLAAIGTPIMGDGKHGGAGAMDVGPPLSRQLHLHAREIAVPHPSGGTLTVTAPMPRHMAAAWAFFGFDESAYDDPFGDDI